VSDHPWVPGLLDDVFGVDAFGFEIPSGQFAWARPCDRSVGALAEDPCECRHNTVEVIGVLPRESPGGRVGINIPAAGCGSLLALGCERQDGGYLLRRADDVAESVYQLAGILGAQQP